LDWGPQKQDNYHGPFPGGGNGTPGGDAARYFVMANGEHDYDQIYSAIDYSGEGWIAPSNEEAARDIANGYDTRFLFSFGPMDLNPGENRNVDVALVGGEYFHQNPSDYDYLEGNETDTTAINQFYGSLNFSNFFANAESAYTIYRGLINDVSDHSTETPMHFQLRDAYPNPFNSTAVIDYSIAEPSKVKLSIYNIYGQLVETLVDEAVSAGNHSVKWNASDLASGIYFYRLDANDHSEVKRMTLIK